MMQGRLRESADPARERLILALAGLGAYWLSTDSQADVTPAANTPAGAQAAAVQPTTVNANGTVLTIYPYGAVKRSAVWHKPGWMPGGDDPPRFAR